jgi:hypothetical protein
MNQTQAQPRDSSSYKIPRAMHTPCTYTPIGVLSTMSLTPVVLAKPPVAINLALTAILADIMRRQRPVFSLLPCLGSCSTKPRHIIPTPNRKSSLHLPIVQAKYLMQTGLQGTRLHLRSAYLIWATAKCKVPVDTHPLSQACLMQSIFHALY